MFRKLQKNHYPVDSAIRLSYNRPQNCNSIGGAFLVACMVLCGVMCDMVWYRIVCSVKGMVYHTMPYTIYSVTVQYRVAWRTVYDK